MRIRAFLQHLDTLGVKIQPNNNELDIHAPEGLLKGDLLKELKNRKLEILNYLKSIAHNNKYEKIKNAEKKEWYKATSAQERMYFLQQLDKANIHYNIFQDVKLDSRITIEEIQQTVDALVQRHESIRTSFSMVNEELTQRISAQVKCQVEYYKIDSDNINYTFSQFVRPFDFEVAPLMRIGYVETLDNSRYVLIDMHHIISDGVSHSILEKEFAQLISGETLPPLRLQYKDYSEWLRDPYTEEKFSEQEEYWLSEFKTPPPLIDIIPDFKRPVIQNFRGAEIGFYLTSHQTKELKRICKENGATLFMTLLSAYNILISKLSNTDDIVIGSPVIGRYSMDIDFIVGLFVNTIVLRNNPDQGKKFNSFLAEVKSNTLKSIENQSYQFEKLVEKLSLPRDSSRNPVFDIMFTLNSNDSNTSEYSYTSDLIRRDDCISKFDLTLSCDDLGENIYCSLEYSKDLYKTETVERFITYLNKIIDSISQNIDIEISNIELISSAEKKQLLYDFNRTATNYPKEKSIPDLLNEISVKYPNNVAIVSGEKQLTFEELNFKSSQLAYHLVQRGVGRNSIVGLMAERTEYLIISILGIMRAGAAYLPLSDEWPEKRIKYMLSDSGCSVILNDEKTKDLNGVNQTFLNVRDEELYREIYKTDLNNHKGSDIAYIIYTSGTTGTPKGTLTTHSNVIRVALNTNYIALSTDDRVLQLSNYAFDGSVFDIYGSLLNGSSLIMIESDDILSIDKLSGIIEEKAITVFFVTTALFNSLVDFNIGKLKGVRKILFGGEQISIHHTKIALQQLGENKLIHVYGPTETTVFASYYNIDLIDNRRGTIPIGKPISNTSIYLLDKSMKPVPRGVPGELYIGGEGVARGYLNNPELSNEKFVLSPFNSGEILYKTGDVGCMLNDGSIEFIDRIDQQVKIRGFRIELGEIENKLLSHKNVKDALVIAEKDERGDKFLCAYVVLKENDINYTKGLRNFLAENLPSYMTPSYFTEIKEIPLTLNGKVNKSALPKININDGNGIVTPNNKIEEKLRAIWSEILNIPQDEISTNISFFDIGGHSLRATYLLSRIHKEFNSKVELKNIFTHQTIIEQSKLIAGSVSQTYKTIPRVEQKEFYPLSSAQKRIYLLQKMYPESEVYNMPGVMQLPPNFNTDRIKEAFLKLILRHESLRTSFEELNGIPYQRIHNEVPFELDNYIVDECDKEIVFEKHSRPFDLANAPLLRVAVVKLRGEKSDFLVFDMHHIICDGTSRILLEKEFTKLYNGEDLPESTIQYKDYAEWQNINKATPRMLKQKKYWIEKFSDDIPLLNIPTDYLRPAIQNFEGASTEFIVDVDLTDKVKKFGKEHDVTLFMTLIAVYKIFLSKITGQEDIIIGAPIASRYHNSLENIVGMFTNTIVLRGYPQKEKIIKDFIQEVKNDALLAFENQEYQFEDLVQALSLNRDTSRNPIFDVFFNLLNHADFRKDFSEGEDKFHHQKSLSKFDLSLTAVDHGGQITLCFEYCTKLFKTETINNYVKQFNRLIGQVVEEPKRKISDLELLSNEDKYNILYNFNNTSINFPADKTILHFFEDQVDKTPDHVALIFGNSILTYKELSNRSTSIANELLQKGVCDNSIVCIIADRSLEMLIGIFGIIKAGCAYLPISPAYPEARKRFILEDSKAPVLIKQNQDVDRINYSCEEMVLDDENIYKNGLTPMSKEVKGKLAYIIYTSGTTGKPKGAMIDHSSLVNRLIWMQKKYSTDSSDTLIQKTPFTFDVSVWELFLWLMNGARLSILTPDGEKIPQKIIETICKDKVSVIHFVPSMLKMFLEYFSVYSSENILKISSIKNVICSGEALSKDDVNKFYSLASKLEGLKLSNLYGPTEATIDVSYFDCSESTDYLSVPIGKPIDNTQLYILSEAMHLQPVGVSGELYIGGVGLSRGYLNRPELSNEKFIPNPFADGSRLYKTGDLAKWLPDGNIEFLGRIDSQVKIRGFRIELKEIEMSLLKVKEIEDVVVIDRKDTANQEYICAYYISKTLLETEEIKKTLKENLPEYMIPAYIIRIDKIPTTENGKVNRKLLPLPEVSKAKNHKGSRNELEQKLVDIWSEVLSINKSNISINANFFELGGNSLKILQTNYLIKERLNKDIEVVKLFTYTTIETIANYIGNEKENVKNYDRSEIVKNQKEKIRNKNRSKK